MFENFYLKIKLVHPYAKIPTRAKSGDAGMDVYTPMPLQIQPRLDVLVSLGWKCEFPEGFVMLFQEKSGRATKDKLDVGACVIDSGYRGFVHVHLFNNSDVPVLIPRGDKIAQFIIVPCWNGVPDQCTELSESDRGEGAFCSTGLN